MCPKKICHVLTMRDGQFMQLSLLTPNRPPADELPYIYESPRIRMDTRHWVAYPRASEWVVEWLCILPNPKGCTLCVCYTFSSHAQFLWTHTTLYAPKCLVPTCPRHVVFVTHISTPKTSILFLQRYMTTTHIKISCCRHGTGGGSAFLTLCTMHYQCRSTYENSHEALYIFTSQSTIHRIYRFAPTNLNWAQSKTNAT